MGSLTGKVALVTGAASGMGRGIAPKLAKEGAFVDLLDLQDTSATEQDIRSDGGQAASLLCDVTDEDQIRNARDSVEKRHQKLDILVNNAGILSGRKPWHEQTREEVNRFLQINFVGYFMITQAFYPLLKKSCAGRVINVASRTYFLANPGQMAYVANKGAVMGMTRVLAKEIGDEGITVNCVAPGMIATEGTMAHSKEDEFERVMQNQAIKKRGKPEHHAALISFLASDEAELITGQMMLADGVGYLH